MERFGGFTARAALALIFAFASVQSSLASTKAWG